MIMPQRTSIAAVKTVMPQPGYSFAPTAKIRPSRESPLKRSQNPNTIGSASAERDGVKVRKMPKPSSTAPPIINQPLPFSFLWNPIMIYIIPDRAMMIPNRTDIVM